MSKNIFEELPSRKGTPAVSQSAPDRGNERGKYREENSTIINKQRKEYRNRPEVKEHTKFKNKSIIKNI